MEKYDKTLKTTLFEVMGNLNFFVEFNSVETPVWFLEFRSGLHDVFFGLIKLWHGAKNQIRSGINLREYNELNQSIIKSLVDCSYQEENHKGRTPEWEQNIQEENLQKGIIKIFAALAEKLRQIQNKFRLERKRQSKKRQFSITKGGIM